ncbi:Imm50 family immunity protein [Streptomyces sp. GQFP]|uniref:Imm50 family immunity protein n=1 Tax=Streptomyces sp. GQFP TaxID=2907545 RepID=UPI001F17FB4E|nr:Imm50 family immunity protein [Streptomyces sp. GQFP]UIX31133.1 immunity 50 family protein [Streptomyces sp. GQFP]
MDCPHLFDAVGMGKCFTMVVENLLVKVSDLDEVRIRSINLNWRGPTVTLRVDLSSFPASPPQEWIDAGMDTVQCQLQFLAAENISLSDWNPPFVGRIEMSPSGRENRIRVVVDGQGMTLRFDCSESVRVNHVSAFRIQADGSDNGPHLFTSRIDARRHTFLPPTDEKTFYER